MTRRRNSAFPKVVIERDADSEESSSDDDDDEGEDGPEPETSEEEGEELPESGNGDKKEDALADAKAKRKAPITISLKKVCKVSPLFCLFLARLSSVYISRFITAFDCRTIVSVLLRAV